MLPKISVIFLNLVGQKIYGNIAALNNKAIFTQLLPLFLPY